MIAPDEAAARAEITDVLARYARGLDRRDFAEIAGCFTAGATAEYSGIRLEPGVDAIVAHVRGVAQLDATTHLFGLPVIDVEGDEARAEIAATAMLVVDGRVRVRGLRYQHRFVCRDGQ
jgi:SnoaL-like domain